MRKLIDFFNNTTLAAILFCLFFTFLIRIPFLPDTIDFNNDAVIYSRNIEKPFLSGTYDVQMPGYVSYIYMGRFFYLFTKNTVIIQHLINIVMMTMITLSFFFLIRRFSKNNMNALLLTCLFSANSILLLGSITGGNRMFLCLASILLLYYALEITVDKKHLKLLVFAAIFAFLTGFRQDLSFYLFPLYLYLFWVVKDIKIILGSLALFALICLTWFIPLMAEYGGISGYLDTMRNADAVYATSFVFTGFALSPVLNVARIFVYLAKAFLFMVPFFIYQVVNKKLAPGKQHLILLALAFFPALIFQMLVHNGNYVQLAAYMAPLFIVTVYNFDFENLKAKILWAAMLCCILFQFYGMKMFTDKPGFYKKLTNVLWLQYTYDGVKTGHTLSLRSIQEDWKKLNK